MKEFFLTPPKKKAGLFLLLLFFFMRGSFLYSNPTDGSVAAGSATITDILKTTLINQSSDKLIINWRDFSIASDETTRFVMPSASSSVLNRVTGGNLSSILGTLQGNGNVYLINPNGVLLGAGANIQCNSFIASTLDLTNENFLTGGDLNFAGDSSAKITNLGKITASGGDVFLIARQIENYGEIRAEKGSVGLASGSEILLKPVGAERIFVKAGIIPSGTAIEQQGYISAIQTELKAAGSLSSLAINNGGFIQATQVERIGGEVYLKAPKGKVRNTGTITATGDQKGGKVVIEGNQIGVAGTIDVSGGEKAGTLNIGGGFQGKDSSIENAQQVKISSEAKLFANNGNGEKSEEKNLVIWSDGVTEYYGAMEAKGSNVEISGKGNLVYQGSVDLGGNGSLLLDPQNLQISNANPGAYTNRTLASDLDQFTDNVAENSYITSTDLLSLLSTGNVTLQANTDITFVNNVDASGATYLNRSLTTNAGRSITFNSNIALTLNGGSYTATINDVGAQAGQRTAGDALFTMSDGSSITTNGGAISVTAGAYGGTTVGSILIGGGTTTATMSTGAGNITLTGVAPSTTNLYGVRLNKGTVQSSNGTINITGTGAAGTTAAYGVELSASSQVISTGTGAISITGTGGAGTTSNYGINMVGSSLIQSSGTGAISLRGTGGNGSSTDNVGFKIGSVGTIITSVTGNILIEGTGNGTGGSAIGINFNPSVQITSTGSAKITLNGTAGSAGTTFNNFGIYFNGGGSASSLISSVNGDITLNGTGTTNTSATFQNPGIWMSNEGIFSTGTASITINGTGGRGTSTNYGIYLLSASKIQSSGTGAITLNGTGGNATASSNFGIFLESANTLVTSATGAIALNGTGGGATTSNHGIRLYNGAEITSTAGAKITLTGAGSTTGTSDNYGVVIDGNSAATTYVSTTTGEVIISGTGGGSTTNNYGFNLINGGMVNSTGAGSISITGKSAGTAVGFRTSTGSNVIGGASATGDITLIANTATAGNDSISLANLSIQTTGKLNLQPLNDSTTIGVNTGATGDFNLSSTDLATITAGNSGVFLGKSTGTGLVDLQTTTWTDGVTVLNTGTGASGITVNGIQTAGLNKNLVLATGAFSNAVGAGALAVSGTGKWLVYVPDAANGTATDITVDGVTPLATLNGLSSKYLYNGTYDTLAPTSITQTGNRFVFATAATLTFTANDAQKNYGESNPNFTYSDPSGLLGTDTQANAFQGTLGTFSAANSVTSPIVLSNGTGASDLNYRFQFVNGTLKTIFNPSSSPAFQKLQSKSGGSTSESTLSKTLPEPIFVNTGNLSASPPLVLNSSLDSGSLDQYQYRMSQDYDLKTKTYEINTTDLKNPQEVGNLTDPRKQESEANQILKRWYQRLLGV